MSVQISANAVNMSANQGTKPRAGNNARTKSFSKALDLAVKTAEKTGLLTANNGQNKSRAIAKDDPAAVQKDSNGSTGIASQAESQAVSPRKDRTDRQTSEESVQSQESSEQPWVTVALNILFFFAQLAEVQTPAAQTANSTVSAEEGLTGNTAVLGLEGVQAGDLAGLIAGLRELLEGLDQPGGSDQLAKLLGLGEQAQPEGELAELTAILTTLTAQQGLGQSVQQTGADASQPANQANSLQTLVTTERAAALSDVSNQLKNLIEQLLQGKVTVQSAAETMLQTPNMLEQLGQLAKLAKMVMGKQQPSGEQQTSGEQQLAVTGDSTEPSAVPVRNAIAADGATGSTKPVQADKTADNKGAQVFKGSTEQVSAEKQQSQNVQTDQTGQSQSRQNILQADEAHAEGPKASLVKSELTLPPGMNEKAFFVNNQAVNVPIQQNSADAQKTMNQAKAVATARELVQQIVFKQIVDESQVLVGRDHSEVRIQLKPESLGKLSLEIAVEHGVFKAEILAESQQVKQLLEANLSNLKQTLTNQGLKVDQLVVNVGQGQTQFGQAKGQNGQSGRSSKKVRVVEEDLDFAEINTEYGAHLVEENQRVDYKI